MSAVLVWRLLDESASRCYLPDYAYYPFGIHNSHGRSVVQKLTVLSKPQKTVKPIASCPRGSVLLLPTTTNLKVTDKDSEAKSLEETSVEVTSQSGPDDMRYFLSPVTADDNMSPFWFVRHTDDQTEANMRVCRFNVTMVTAADFVGQVLPTADELSQPPPAKRRRRAKGPSVGEAEPGPSEAEAEKDEEAMGVSTVTIPAMINLRALAADEELLLYKMTKERQDKEERSLKPISMRTLRASKKAASDSTGSAM